MVPVRAPHPADVHRLDRTNGTYGGTWTPAADVWESDDAYHLVLHLPGVRRDAVEITLEHDVLAIRATATPQGKENARLLLAEYGNRTYMRSFRFGRDVLAADVQARHHDGVLEVTVPKAADARPRRIEVK